MKSMLHEASSVIKAIEKAWVDSDRPAEFTVNVLEVGEKGLFGLTTKRPAVVSITYDPRKNVHKNSEKNKKQHSQAQRPSKQQDMTTPLQQQKKVDTRNYEQDGSHNRPKRDQNSFKQAPSSHGHDIAKLQKVVDMESGQKQSHVEQEDSWSTELVADAKVWFNDVITSFGGDLSFEISTDKKGLFVDLNKDILEHSDDQRQLFGSLSYLVIQFLKKKHKKKLRGYHVMLNVKKHGLSDKSAHSSNR